MASSFDGHLMNTNSMKYRPSLAWSFKIYEYTAKGHTVYCRPGRGRVIQTGGPWVRVPCPKEINSSSANQDIFCNL